MATSSAEVLVVGAGPSGLFAAVELTRHGVHARLVERTPAPHGQARATALQPGTLEILARAGVLDEVLAASEHLGYARVFDADLRLVAETSFAGAGCVWEIMASLPQHRTESILQARLDALGGSVERGVTVTSVEPRDDLVLVGLQRADGTQEAVEVDRVVGAGGARSITRESMGETLVGDTYPGTALVADIRLKADMPRDSGNLVATPAGYVLLGPLPERRWITFIGDLDPDEEQGLVGERSVANLAAAMDRRIRGAAELEDVAWSSLFTMYRRQVPHLAGRRRFLLGDAGHLSSPFGGEGLNSGLHDAHNLGWKLALVLQGKGRESLLESFAYERAMADRHVLEVSDLVHDLAHGAVQAQQTGVAPPPLDPAQAMALTRSRTMLDGSYAGSPVVGSFGADEADPSAGPAPGQRYPEPTGLGTRHRLLVFGDVDQDAFGRLRDRWDGLVEVIRNAEGGDGASAGTLLLRPDGYIGFRSDTADRDALVAVDAHLDSYLIAG